MRKIFTVEQANRTLPLVSRIVQDIVTQYGRWQDRVREFEVAAASARIDRPQPRAEALQHQVQELAREIEGYVDELTQLGVEFKGFDLGLVDFPGEMGGRPVYLCWKLGEPAVEYWHEQDAGYAGRQRLTPLAVA
jgi:hypothetical protein